MSAIILNLLDATTGELRPVDVLAEHVSFRTVNAEFVNIHIGDHFSFLYRGDREALNWESIKQGLCESAGCLIVFKGRDEKGYRLCPHIQDYAKE